MGPASDRTGATPIASRGLLRETHPDELSPREALDLLYRLKGLVAEEIGRDRVPWSTGRYCENPDSGPSNDRLCAGKSLILRDVREQIRYAIEQGNKSDEQGDKIDDQGIKSAEHGKGPTGRIRTAAAAEHSRLSPFGSRRRLGEAPFDDVDGRS